MRVLMAGGGTGGHLYPAIAVAQELAARHKGPEILFVVGRKMMEREIVAQYGFKFVQISAKGMPRKAGIKLLGFAAAALVSTFEVLFLLLRWRPNVILGTGGYVSGPVLTFGWLLRIPCVVQEQNSVPGLTNRFLSRLAEEVHLTFAESRKYFNRKDNLKLTGNPVRKELLRCDKDVGLQKLGLTPDRLTVLIMGGSTGAHSVNLAAVGALNKLFYRKDLQFILQTGKQDFQWVKQSVQPFGDRVVVKPYIASVGEVYCCADLMVCRAGAMTVSEVAACGIPAIFVPYPHAIYDHQVQNARNLVDRGAAEMILDRELNADILAATIGRLTSDESRLKRMSINARSFARLDTAERIAKALVDIGEARKRSHRNVHDY
ncbi:MAG: undecaprenyldiphospho-muramoylpentapeptide beta-N-acetylglucosaminyltransferase [Candidatus Eisenbacteria bacterium]|nr:undecaprenyldiphospho-muramoylpentapeptide beta-N-acetylglucosaminyltransferase [Candidatus Eisenbacteria bacterium]